MTCSMSPTEVKAAVFDNHEDKAPGTDGYTATFFKNAWPIIGEEICRAVIQFFLTGKRLKQANNTLITLVPKVAMPSAVADFRPISSANVLYEVISKLLVERMKTSLHKLVDTCQNASIPCRRISDNILLAQELLQGYNQRNSPDRCVVKVDLKKAYDSVSWDFLLASLQALGFHSAFFAWIEVCISTTSYFIVINGQLYGFFQGARGLKVPLPICTCYGDAAGHN